jgi:hypothetical protein
MLQFMWWVVHDGQNFSEGLEYGKLPASVVTLNEATLRSVTYNGQSLVS